MNEGGSYREVKSVCSGEELSVCEVEDLGTEEEKEERAGSLTKDQRLVIKGVEDDESIVCRPLDEDQVGRSESWNDSEPIILNVEEAKSQLLRAECATEEDTLDDTDIIHDLNFTNVFESGLEEKDCVDSKDIVGTYIFETFCEVDQHEKKRLLEMIPEESISHVISHCDWLRRRVPTSKLRNVKRRGAEGTTTESEPEEVPGEEVPREEVPGGDSGCDSSIEEEEEGLATGRPLPDPELDEGFYDTELPKTVFMTSRVGTGSGEVTASMTVNRKVLTGVIDTGAQVSCLNRELALTMDPKPVMERAVRLVGIKPGSVMMGHYAKIRLDIGKITYWQQVVIAPIENEFILGADFLTTRGAVLDFKKSYMSIEGYHTPITVSRPGISELGPFPVRLIRETMIPAHTAKTVTVSVEGAPEEGDICIESLPGSEHGLIVPAGMYDTGHYHNILVYNFGGADVRLAANTPVAQGDGVKFLRKLDASELNTGPAPEGGSPKTRSSESDPKFPEDIYRMRDEVPEHLKLLFMDSLEGLSVAQAEEFKETLIEFSDAFSKDPLDLGSFTEFQHTIPTGENIPFRDRFRRTPLKHVEAERKHVQELLDKEVIRPSKSAWCAMPVLAKKPDGTLRFCIDYRGLNSRTKFDCHPLPHIEDCLQSLAGSSYMSSLDLASGYWQIEIAPEDRPKTAFQSMMGLYEWNKMAFGLVSAPATFQRAMHIVLGGLLFTSAVAYLDDIIVYSRGDSASAFGEHLHNLKEVLRRFMKYNLKLKPSKCKLMRRRLKVLGKVVDSTGIRVDPSKKDAVKTWTTPQDAKALRRYIGFINFSRDHIPRFAEIAAPLYELMTKCLKKIAKASDFVWTEQHERAFRQLNDELLQSKALAHVRPEGKVILKTDASKIAVGAALYQVQDGEEKLVSYFSRKMTPAMQKKCATQLELIAVAASVHHFSPILTGREWQLVTDHSSLRFLWSAFKYGDCKLSRILEYLSQFSFAIRHEKGSDLVVPDALSRMCHDLEPCKCYYTGCSVADLPCGGCNFCKRAFDDWQKYEDDVMDLFPPGVISDSGTPGNPSVVDTSDLAARSRPAGDPPERVVADSISIGSIFLDDFEPEELLNFDVLEGGRPEVETSEELEAELIEEEEGEVAPPEPLNESWKENFRKQGEQTVTPLTAENLRALQYADPDISPVIAWLEEGVDPTREVLFLASPAVKYYWLLRAQLRLINGVLYYEWIRSDDETLVLVVPMALKPFIIHQCHDAATALHQGRDRTLTRARASFIWYKMADYIQTYVRTCSVCIRSKHAPRKAQARRRSYVPGSPFERVALDIFGPVSPISASGARYVLVIRDLFSRFTVMVALPDQSAKSVAEAMLKHWVSVFGAADSVHSDQGSCFEAALYKEFCRLFELHKSRCTTYHPIANASVEKTNLFLANALRAMVVNNHKNWDSYLPLITMVNNSMVNASTGYTPYRLVFGKEMRLPVHTVLPDVLRMERTHSEWVKHLDDQLACLHKIARRNIGLTQKRQKRLSDINCYERIYRVGDYVYKINTTVVKGQSKKLEKKFAGPFMIVEGKTSSGKAIQHPLYCIRNHRRKDNVIHHDRLILASDRVAVPLWLHRQRKEVVQCVEQSIATEQRRIAKDMRVKNKKAPYITRKNTPQLSVKAGVEQEVTELSSIRKGPLGYVRIPMVNSDLDITIGSEAVLSVPVNSDMNTTLGAELAHMINSDLDETIGAEAPGTRSGTVSESDPMPTVANEEVWPTEEVFPCAASASSSGMVHDPEGRLKKFHMREEERDRPLLNPELVEPASMTELFEEGYTSRAGRRRKPAVVLDL